MHDEMFLSPVDDGSAADEPEGEEQRQRRDRNEEVRRESEQKPVEEDIFPAIKADEDDAREPTGDDLTPVRPIVGAIDPTPQSQKIVTRIEVPIRTIVTVAISLFLIWVLIQIWGILLQVLLAFLLATALLPL